MHPRLSSVTNRRYTKTAIASCTSIRVQIRAHTILVCDVPEGQQRMLVYFSTAIYDVDDTQHLDLQKVAAHLSKQLDDFNRRGGGFVL